MDGDGWPRQEAACREFIQKKGWQVVRVFKEQQSGSDEWADRAQLREAMELAGSSDYLYTELGPVNRMTCGSAGGERLADAIIVERADRLSRDLVVSEMFIRDCKERNIKIYAADCGEEMVNATGDATRTLIRQVLGAVAQWEKSVIVKKMQAGRRAKAERTGKPCGGPVASPYGDRGTLGQRNLERAVVRQIFVFREQGMGYYKIADRLYKSRTPNPSGKGFTWDATQVLRIVKYWEVREL